MEKGREESEEREERRTKTSDCEPRKGEEKEEDEKKDEVMLMRHAKVGQAHLLLSSSLLSLKENFSLSFLSQKETQRKREKQERKFLSPDSLPASGVFYFFPSLQLFSSSSNFTLRFPSSKFLSSLSSFSHFLRQQFFT